MIVKKRYDLSQTFSKRLAYDAAGLLVTQFTGLAETVFIKIQDVTDPLEAARGVRVFKDTPLHFTLTNRQAQSGIIEILLVSTEMLGALTLYDLPNPELIEGAVTVGSTAIQLPSHVVTGGLSVNIIADGHNTETIYVGGSGVTVGNGIALDPGSSYPFTVSNTNQLYLISTGSQKATFVVGNQTGQTAGIMNPTGVATAVKDLLTTPVAFDSQPVPPGISVYVSADPNNSDYIYIGGSSVTTSDGQQLAAGSGMRLWVKNTNAIYGVSATTGQKMRYIVEVNV